ncbi:MAG: tetratricopeptide repeat protein, partial [Candidatus Neomarinimicrobiota bacterium]
MKAAALFGRRGCWLLGGSLWLLPLEVAGQIRDPYAEAQRYFELGRYERASSMLQEILEREPECGECYDLLARVATSQGQDSLAAVWYRRALAIEPDNAGLYHKLGFAEHRSGDLLQAIEDLEYSLELNPTSGEAQFALGNVWYDLESLAQAKQLYQAALALDSTEAKYHFQLGMVYFSADSLDSALVEFRSAYQLYPKYSLAYEFAANILLKQARWSEVVAVLEEGLASATETEVTRFWLGVAHNEIGNYARAEELLRGYVTQRGDHLAARYNLGLALYEIGEYEEAVEHLTLISRKLPDLLKGWLYLGRSLNALDRDSLAYAALDTLLSKDSTHYEAWIERGNLDLKQDRYDRAMSRYDLAGRISPARWETYHRRGLALYLQEAYGEAELQLLRAAMLADSAEVVYALLGDVAAAMGEDDFAIYYYGSVLRMRPEDAVTHGKLVDALVRLRMWRSARAELLWFLDREPRNEAVLYRLGMVVLADGDTTAARQYREAFWQRHSQRRERERLELRISVDGRNPRHYRELGWHYYRRENQTRARAYFRRAVALGDTTLPARLYLDEGES